jgi:hypothetical protein
MFDGWASFWGVESGQIHARSGGLPHHPDQLRGNRNRHWLVWQHFLYQDRGRLPCVLVAHSRCQLAPKLATVEGIHRSYDLIKESVPTKQISAAEVWRLSKLGCEPRRWFFPSRFMEPSALSPFGEWGRESNQVPTMLGQITWNYLGSS